MRKVMKTIIREYKALLILMGAMYFLFLFTVILDHTSPRCNLHLQFPDRVYDLLYLYPWQKELYSNLLLIFTLIFPFVFLYKRMLETAKRVFEFRDSAEGELGNSRRLLFQKLGECGLRSFVICMALFLENAFFFLLVGNKLMIGLTWGFFFRLFWIGMIYVAAAAFVAVFAEEMEACGDINIIILLVPFVLARMHALVRFFSDQLVELKKKPSNPELVEAWIKKLNSLQVMAPITWCAAGMRYPVWYWMCGALIVLVLGIATISALVENKDKRTEDDSANTAE